jgi:hypothetical protein
MAVQHSISEIIDEACSIKGVDEKVEWLIKNDSVPLRMVLQCTYDKKRVNWLIPDSPPPWNKNEFEDEAKSLLFTEARRLKIFIEGGGYENLNKAKRETLFIQLLQDIDNDDAYKLAHHSISQKPFKGLTTKTINKAFPNLIAE